jgi:hypothetical protein
VGWTLNIRLIEKEPVNQCGKGAGVGFVVRLSVLLRVAAGIGVGNVPEALFIPKIGDVDAITCPTTVEIETVFSK